jgi:hypothetical protein
VGQHVGVPQVEGGTHGWGPWNINMGRGHWQPK